MIKDKKIEKLDGLLDSINEFTQQAKQIAFNLASAASRSRNSLPLRIGDDILDLVTQTIKVSEEISKMVKIVRMEVSGLYSLDQSGELKFEKDEVLQEKIEKYLQNILNESQRLLLVMRKLKSISIDNKL
jgi:hypothetical protein